jgi:hypothetical protein
LRAWPTNLPKAGILVVGDDTIPFVDFLIADSFVVVERDKPDTQGARKIVVALAAISAVKLTTVEPLTSLRGFLDSASSDATAVPARLARDIDRELTERSRMEGRPLSALERASRPRT